MSHRATHANLACVSALLLLQVAWHGMQRWPGGSLALLLLLGAPLAAVFLMHLAQRRSARFWTGVVALLLFCHGIAEAWALPAARLPALAEVALSVAAVVTSSWDGLRARFGRRRPTPPTV